MNMVEKVARAICERRVGDPDRIVGVLPLKTSQWCLFADDARAAIEAMMEHTPEMDSAGYDAYPDSAIRTGVDHLDIYRAMIQAALKEGQ